MEKLQFNDLFNSIENNYDAYKWVYLSLLYIIFIILSFFIVPIADASLYFHETVHILETLKSLQWIGNEPVGTHGFLFKLIPAFLLGIMGINPVVLSLYHVSLSFFTVLIFEKILSHYFNDKKIIFSGIVLFSASYFFITSSVSYTREIPVLFSSVILFYSLVKGRSKWIIGLLLLIVLDAKEHVFFQIAPGIFFFHIYSDLIRDKDVFKFLLNNICLWIFSIIYVFLMMYTGLIPVNSFIISILPLSEVGTQWVKSGFVYGALPKNPDLYMNPFKGVFLLEQIFDFRQLLIGTYLAKPFLPRVIGFQSMPILIVLPSVIESVKQISYIWKKEKNNATICLAYITIFYLLIYFLRASHGRYLLSITPVLVLQFLIFIRDNKSQKKSFFLAMIILVLWGLFFEITYIVIKICFYLLTLFLLYLSLYREKRSVLIFSVVLAFIMGSAALGAMYSLEGSSLDKYITYGRFEQYDKILDEVEIDRNIYTNSDNIGNMRAYLRTKVPEYFLYNKFDIKGFFPKRELSKSYQNDPNVITFKYKDIEDFKINLEANSIGTIILFIEEGDSIAQNLLQGLLNGKISNYNIEKSLRLKNRNVFIFTNNE